MPSAPPSSRASRTCFFERHPRQLAPACGPAPRSGPTPRPAARSARPRPARCTRARGRARPGCGPRAAWAGARSGRSRTVSATRAQGSLEAWPQTPLQPHGRDPQRRDEGRPRGARSSSSRSAYWMEIETVMSYIANSINPDGVRAQEIIESLEQDIQEELGHARQFGAAHQGALRRGAGLARLPGRAVLPPAARRADRHRPRHQGRDRGRDRRDRALQPDHRVLRGPRPGDPGHGDRRSCATRRATAACSRASCASTRPRAWPSYPARPRRSTTIPKTPASTAITPTTVGSGPPWMPVSCTAVWPLPRWSSQRFTG